MSKNMRQLIEEIERKERETMPCIDSTCDKNGTAIQGSVDDPEPVQCQFCYEVRFPAIERLKEHLATVAKNAHDEAEADGAKRMTARIRGVFMAYPDDVQDEITYSLVEYLKEISEKT